jgi:hypothetical protein
VDHALRRRIWHGSTGSFALFGIFHGTLVAATYWYRRVRPLRAGSLRWPAMLGTFLLFALSMVAFRADDGSHALSLYSAILAGVHWDPAQWGPLARRDLARRSSRRTLQRRAGRDLRARLVAAGADRNLRGDLLCDRDLRKGGRL